MAIRGLKEGTVNKIGDAFRLGHEIFKSLDGWPYCTIYRLNAEEGARDGDGKVKGIEILSRFRSCEADNDQLSITAAAGVEQEAYDITFTFYDFIIPNKSYRIVFGEWVEDQEPLDPDSETPEKEKFGPRCPRCNGTGIITDDESGKWNNPDGVSNQCSYCGGLGFDIYDIRVHFYGLLRVRATRRMGEFEVDCYSLNNENMRIASIIDDMLNQNQDGLDHTPTSTAPDVDYDLLNMDVDDVVYDSTAIQHSENSFDYLLDYLDDPINNPLPSWDEK